MAEETTKVKVVELVGQKLDPNAKYVFAFNRYSITLIEAENVKAELNRVLGHNDFVVVMFKGSPEESMKVFEIPQETVNHVSLPDPIIN